MKTETLKAVTRSRWSFIFGIWGHRETISCLCRMFDALPEEEAQLRKRVVESEARCAESQQAKELYQREAEVLNRQLATAQSDLRELHKSHSELIRKKEDPEERAARDALHLAKLDLAHSAKQLDSERTAHAKTKRHVEVLWRFISLRHRVDVPAPEGSIRKILQESEIP